ncbi:hypothetical protein M91_08288, partial [Bos mutus]
AACLFRVNALSLVYLLFLLLLPWFPGPSRHSIRGKATLGVLPGQFLSWLFRSQVPLPGLWCLVRLSAPMGTGSTGDAITWDAISRLTGVTRLDLKDISNAIRLVAPDLGILVVSSLCLGVCRRLTRTARRSQHVQEPVRAMGHPRSQPFEDCCIEELDTGSLGELREAPELSPTRRSRLAARFRITAHWLLVAAGRTLAIMLLALAAFSSVYFLLFLAIGTWWACHFPISLLGFNTLCVMVSCVGTGHLICLYCYQTPLAQATLPPAGIWARVFGLKDFLAPTNCSSPNVLVINANHDWPVYVSPGILLLLCYTVTSLLKLHAH